LILIRCFKFFCKLSRVVKSYIFLKIRLEWALKISRITSLSNFSPFSLMFFLLVISKTCFKSTKIYDNCLYKQSYAIFLNIFSVIKYEWYFWCKCDIIEYKMLSSFCMMQKLKECKTLFFLKVAFKSIYFLSNILNKPLWFTCRHGQNYENTKKSKKNQNFDYIP